MNKATIALVISVILSILAIGGYFHINSKIKNLEGHHQADTTEYSYALDCVREAEIEYYKWYAMYVSEVQNYITSVAPTSNLRGYALVDLCEKYKVDIKFVLAQGEIESHFGTTGLGERINNVFNVGCYDGLSIAEIDPNYKKKHPNESIEPYLKLITTKYLVGKLETDLIKNYVDVNGKRYASNELYEEMMQTKYDYITKNTKIDEYRAMMKNYAVKCNR